jgi:hypothetical protein
MATVQNFTIFRGITFAPAVLTYTNAAGVAVDLTGYSVFAQARSEVGEALAFDLLPTISTPGTGQITIAMTAAQTENLVCGRYGWDLVLKSGAGAYIGPIFAGAIVVSDIFTQPTS